MSTEKPKTIINGKPSVFLNLAPPKPIHTPARYMRGWVDTARQLAAEPAAAPPVSPPPEPAPEPFVPSDRLILKVLDWREAKPDTPIAGTCWTVRDVIEYAWRNIPDEIYTPGCVAYEMELGCDHERLRAAIVGFVTRQSPACKAVFKISLLHSRRFHFRMERVSKPAPHRR